MTQHRPGGSEGGRRGERIPAFVSLGKTRTPRGGGGRAADGAGFWAGLGAGGVAAASPRRGPPRSVTARAWPWAPPGMRRSRRRAPGLGSGALPASGSFPAAPYGRRRAALPPSPAPGEPPVGRSAGSPSRPRRSSRGHRRPRGGRARTEPAPQHRRTKVPAEHPRGLPWDGPGWEQRPPRGRSGPRAGCGCSERGGLGREPGLLSFYGYRFPAESLWLHVVSGAVVGDSRGQQMLWQRSSRQPWDVFLPQLPPEMLDAGHAVVGCHWPPRASKLSPWSGFFHRMRLRFTSPGHSLGQALWKG